MPREWLSIVVNMRRIVVVADDITGAAEIAGIAKRHGLSVSMMVFDKVVEADLHIRPSIAQCFVVATDTRSMDVEDAVKTTDRVVSWIHRQWGDEALPPHTLWFKKTDSALRGHVMEELEVLIAVTGYKKVLYFPANPSKGRTIQDGFYYIQGIPIDQTDFSFDPEFPATTANIEERFPQINEVCKMKNKESFNSEPMAIADSSFFIHHSSFFYANASTVEDVRHAVRQTDDGFLLAGAADLFEAFIILKMEDGEFIQDNWPSQRNLQSSIFNLHSSLLVCGSTQSRPHALGFPVLEIPREVYDGEKDVDEWMESFLATQHLPKSLALSFGNNTHRIGKEAAQFLRNVMAKAAKRIIDTYHPKELMIEGGATAFRLLQLLGWHSLSVKQELTSGVVRMQTDNNVFVTLKPGSYDWGKNDSA